MLKSKLKILVKVRDEPDLLEPWLLYHAALVGWENIIVFDNESGDLKTLNIYKKYENTPLTVVTITGNLFWLYSNWRSLKLYQMLELCTDFFIHLDVDEYLVNYNKNTHTFDTNVLQVLNEVTINEDIAIPWLHNTPTREIINCNQPKKSVYFELNPYTIKHNINWGKVCTHTNNIFTTDIDTSLYSNAPHLQKVLNNKCNFHHNINRPNCKVSTSLFILHIDKVSVEGRIVNSINLIRGRTIDKEPDVHGNANALEYRPKLMKFLDEWIPDINYGDDLDTIKYLEKSNYHKIRELLSYSKNKSKYLNTLVTFNSKFYIQTNIIESTLDSTPYSQIFIYEGKEFKKLTDIPFMGRLLQ